jgi:hypothetical protein
LKGPRPAKELVPDALRSIDCVARLAEAWDGKGRNPLTPPYEHAALLARAGLLDLAHQRMEGWLFWDSLTPDQRRRLLIAARDLVELGRACAWVFGEGRGA